MRVMLERSSDRRRTTSSSALLTTSMLLRLAATPLLNAPVLDTGSDPEAARIVRQIGMVLVA